MSQPSRLRPPDPLEAAIAAAAELLELHRPVDSADAEVLLPASQQLRELAALVRAERNVGRAGATGADASAHNGPDPLPTLLGELARVLGVEAPSVFPNSTRRRRQLAFVALVRIRRGAS